MNFEDVLVEKRKLVWQEIQGYFVQPPLPHGFGIQRKYHQLAKFHWEIVTEYPKRQGKYLRPALVLLTCEALGVSQKRAIKTAAAMQTSEDWILAHDDFEDNSLLRRGEPTLHRKFGPELAINGSDTLHIIMWRMLFDNYNLLGGKLAGKIIDEFYKMLMRAALGQSIEILWTKQNRANLTDDDWFFIADGKTVYYTTAGPMRLGAIIAGVTTQQLDRLFEFGVYLGRCFQIVDDLLDLTSDFRGLKQQFNDIYEGKRTLMLGHLLRKVSVRDRKQILGILQKTREEKTPEEVKWMVDKMNEYGSIEYGKKIAEKLSHKARDYFEGKLKFLKHEPARTYLREGIEFILKRDY